MDDGLGGDFFVILGLETSSLRNVITLTAKDNAIIARRFYRFKYRCQNENGFSDYSDITYIQAAQAPSTPLPPKLIGATAQAIELQFFKPIDDGGSEITGYQLFINDGTETEPTT
jgi:hypothetical protein